MRKNVIWWPAMKNQDLIDKYGGYDYFKYSRQTWEYWCKRNDVLFVPFENPVEEDLFRFRPNWQKTIFVFDELERMGIEYDQIALMDSSTMIKWNAPNFFNLTGNKFTAWRDSDNLKWIYDSISGYKDFFNGYKLDITRYFSSGLIIFNKNHKELFDRFKQFYLDNIEQLIKLQDNTVKKGTEQTPLNYFVQMEGTEINMDLPVAYKLTHIHRKEMFNHNWQLNEDKTPFFIKYGYNWVFNGIPKDQRTRLMGETWNLVKEKYNVDEAKYDVILDLTSHRNIERKTTSRKFKKDVLKTFLNDEYKDKTIVEIGCHKGNSTKFLSKIFGKVIAIDKWHLEDAKEHCSDCKNVEFVNMDLYYDNWGEFINEDVDVVFIDGGHEYWQVKSDIENSFRHFGSPIFIFDDYGLPPGEVKKAIDEKVNEGKLTINKFIGETPKGLVHISGIKFFDIEGCICNL